MNERKLWFSALMCLISTALWLVLMIASVSKTGPIITLEHAIDSVVNTGFLFKALYINAVLVTITATVFLVCLYYYFRRLNFQWSLMALVFVPIYSVLNLVVYFSQITMIPQLIAQMIASENPEVYRVIVGQLVQGWSGSAIGALNQFAYAILGIPSIIFGLLMIKGRNISILAGWFLTLNGIACIVGAIGTVANNQILENGTVIGGVFFLFALISIVHCIKLSNSHITVDAI